MAIPTTPNRSRTTPSTTTTTTTSGAASTTTRTSRPPQPVVVVPSPNPRPLPSTSTSTRLNGSPTKPSTVVSPTKTCRTSPIVRGERGGGGGGLGSTSSSNPFLTSNPTISTTNRSPSTSTSSARIPSTTTTTTTTTNSNTTSFKRKKFNQGWFTRQSEGGINVVVSAPFHQRRLDKGEGGGSWLHLFEHARYLHAGLPQGNIVWPDYPSREEPTTPHLLNIHNYLTKLSTQHNTLNPNNPIRLTKPEFSSLETCFPMIESKREMNLAFKQGTIHFSAQLNVVSNDSSSSEKGGSKLVQFKLCPPQAGMGSSLYRKFGSDRFLRVKLDDEVLRFVGPTFDRSSSSSSEETSRSSSRSTTTTTTTTTPPPPPTTIRSQILEFFSHPLLIFGRYYSPFCVKDGSVVYFCTTGIGIEVGEERSLTRFAQEYLEAELNSNMSVAKYCARFELGLTTTTPTVTFPRNRVLRTPDLKSDSLKVSIAMMLHIRDLFRRTFSNAERDFLPDGYLPSCIRGHYGLTNDDKTMLPLVWQLDYTSPNSSTSRYIHVHRLPSTSSTSTSTNSMRCHFKFTILLKDGKEVSVWTRFNGGELRWGEKEWNEENQKKGNVDMTDGCSLMSYSAMEILARKNSEARGDAELLRPVVPPVAQGRLGPGKGVWCIAPPSTWEESSSSSSSSSSDDPSKRWIEVRDSQWKFEDRQTQMFTFELHSIPNSKGSAKLGKQMFEVLSHCGVPLSAFREMLRSQVETSQSAFYYPPSMPALLYHVEKSCGVLEDRTLKAKIATDPSGIKLVNGDTSNGGGGGGDDVLDLVGGGGGGEGFVHDSRLDPISAAPNTVQEVVVQTLQNGFEPRTNPHLAAKLKMVADAALEKQLSFKVDDEYSRTAFVIADHLGVLEEGEFFFQCSEPLPAANGRGRVNIVDGPALLSRSPAVQPCDVQKVRGVYQPEYRTYYDVIIVSTKGDRSLCSILSGGDYDGDKLICMTHPAIVEKFDSTRADPSFADVPFKDSDWFDVDRRKVGEVIGPIIANAQDSQLADIFLESLFQGTFYGMPSKYHTTLAYKLGIDHPLTSECGHLFCRALDGRKQGLSFSQEFWQLAKQKFWQSHKEVPKWTLAEAGTLARSDERFAKRPSSLGRHPMDELDSERGKLREIAKGEWTNWCQGLVVEVDDDLASEWRNARDHGLQARDRGHSAFFDDLETLLQHVRTVYEEYKDMFIRWRRAKEAGKAESDLAYIPGSPTKKSPSKKGTEWKGSSKSRKEDLLALTKRFWSIIDPRSSPFRSDKLRGEDGARLARALIASCAYIEPLRPTPAPPSIGTRPLIDRFLDTTSSRTSVSTTPSITHTSAITTNAIPATSTPLEDDSDFDQYFGDTRYSQVDDFTCNSTVPRSLPFGALINNADDTSSTQSSATLKANSPLASRTTSPERRGLSSRATFGEAASRAPNRFCFDMAHRDVLNLKANGITRRLHGGNARGIGAPCVAENMLDVMQVSKRCSGIASARTKIRPRSLIPESSGSPILESPAKRQRLG